MTREDAETRRWVGLVAGTYDGAKQGLHLELPESLEVELDGESVRKKH